MMATGRMIRSQISTSSQVNDLSLKSALLFTWIIPHVDDFGRLNAHPRRIKATVVPMRDDISVDDITDALIEMLDQKLIVIYSVVDDVYIELCKFDRHQTGLHKRTESKLPAPEPANLLDSGKFREIPGNSGKFRVNRTEEKRTELNRTKPKNNMSSCVIANHPVWHKNQTVIFIFDFWKNVMNHPKAIIDKKRAKAIITAIDIGYSVEEIKMAIVGCSKNPFNMKQNDRGKKYDDICLILRDSPHIEGFIEDFKNPPVPPAKKLNNVEHNQLVLEEFKKDIDNHLESLGCDDIKNSLLED